MSDIPATTELQYPHRLSGFERKPEYGKTYLHITCTLCNKRLEHYIDLADTDPLEEMERMNVLIDDHQARNCSLELPKQKP